MKAREIVAKLNEYLETHHPYVECDTCLNAFEDLRYLVDGFCEEEEPINWEQRRYELAKEAMNGTLSAPVVGGVDPSPSIKEIAEYSVMLADALIKELKGNKK